MPLHLCYRLSYSNDNRDLAKLRPKSVLLEASVGAVCSRAYFVDSRNTRGHRPPRVAFVPSARIWGKHPTEAGILSELQFLRVLSSVRGDLRGGLVNLAQQSSVHLRRGIVPSGAVNGEQHELRPVATNTKARPRVRSKTNRSAFSNALACGAERAPDSGAAPHHLLPRAFGSVRLEHDRYMGLPEAVIQFRVR